MLRREHQSTRMSETINGRLGLYACVGCVGTNSAFLAKCGI